MATKYYLDKLDDNNELIINDEGGMASYKNDEVYHVFWDNQVLTASQLNKVIERLEEEDRLTRTRLIGSGLHHGFKVKFEDGIISISSGLGITTDGDLIIPKKIQEFVNNDDILNKIQLNVAKNFEDKCNYFNQETGLKLTHKNGAELDNDISEKILVLYLETFDKEPGICDEEDCDNQGPVRIENYHFLLFDEDQLATLIETDTLLAQDQQLKQSIGHISNLKLEKVSVKHTNISYSSLVNQYTNAIKNGQNKINDAIDQWNALYADFTPLAPVNLSANFGSGVSPVQHYYSHIKHLMEALNELTTLALNTPLLNPNALAFPKHLLLGKLSDISNNRHSFYPSLSLLSGQFGLDKLESMILRFNAMVSSFNFSIDNNLNTIITPSKQLRATLSDKAIPVFYNANMLHTFWDFIKTKTGKAKDYLHHKRSASASQDYYKNPLNYQHLQHDFYRIEGHQGKSEKNVMAKLKSTITNHNLPFKVLSFELSSDSLKTFLKEHSGLEHLGGTWRNGTFVLLYENGTVIADFCLPYRVHIQTDSRDVVTASYPWISSLKYINNLSRTHDNDKHVNAPTFYKLKVSQYTISGHNLLRTPLVTINIPIKDLFYRRMHIVAERLNRAFPKGLVFDYDEQRKRLNITRMRGHQFTFSVQDVTFGDNNDNPKVYKFTNNRVYLNGNPYTYGKVIERFYDSSEYSDLHEKYAPVSKDDDYGTYYSKWADWNRLIDRIKKVFSDRILDTQAKIRNSHSSKLKKNVVTLCKAIRAEDTSAQIFLIGDFLNGTWVSYEMLRNNNKTVKDFLEVRKLLHHKTGASDLSVLVTTGKANFSINRVKEGLDFNVNILLSDNEDQPKTDITSYVDNLR